MTWIAIISMFLAPVGCGIPDACHVSLLLRSTLGALLVILALPALSLYAQELGLLIRWRMNADRLEYVAFMGVGAMLLAIDSAAFHVIQHKVGFVDWLTLFFVPLGLLGAKYQSAKVLGKPPDEGLSGQASP